MNYLAHIFLSGNDPEHQIGGFIGDFVKGDFKGQFTDKIEYGIQLHREIDRVSDYLPSFKNSRSRINPEYSRFSGIFIDIFYDHFLAKNWNHFHHQPLIEFSREFMTHLEQNKTHIPATAQPFIGYMKRYELFDYYIQVNQIGHVFQGMSNRFRRKNPLAQGQNELEKNYQLFEDDFNSFMIEMNDHLNQYLRNS